MFGAGALEKGHSLLRRIRRLSALQKKMGPPMPVKKNRTKALRTSLHEEMRDLVHQMYRVTNQILENGVRLSLREHRGRPCIMCKRPIVNDMGSAYEYRDGDAPDLCWGNCDKDHD